MKKTSIVLIALVMVCSLTTRIFADGTEPYGSGTASDPYQVATLDNLLWISTNESCWGYNYIQTADIDASATLTWNGDEGWSSIGEYYECCGVYPFTGTYNGQGHSISNLYINRSGDDHQGLFGWTDGATIENVGVVDCDITGASNVGGLIGISYQTTVTACYTTGAVSGTSNVGGLIGEQNNNPVTKCYSTCSVSGLTYVGGFIGMNYQTTVTACYTTGSVSAISFVGGFIGYQFSGTATSCYWDIDTSGQSTSAGGTGKTTAEMKMQSTYIDWDFTNTWIIHSYHNNGYPYLQDNNNLSVDPEAGSSFKEMHVLNYPNPVKNSTTISYSIKGIGNNELVDVGIYNLHGRLIERIEATGGSLELNTEHYAPGIYLYKVAHEKKTLTGKMVVVK